MVKIVRDPVTGLTPQQEAFAVALAKGLSQADAYRQAVNVRPSTKDTSIHVNACKMAANHNVKQRVRQILSEARVADIDNVGQAWRDLLDLLEEARKEKNYTAVAAFMRQRLTGLGTLQHKLTVTHESTLSDTELVRRLVGNDAEKAEILRSVLTPDSFEEESVH